MEEMDRGCKLMMAADFENAARHLLWCWDHGTHCLDAFEPVKVSFLSGYLKALCIRDKSYLHEMYDRKKKLIDRIKSGAGTDGDRMALNALIRDFDKLDVMAGGD